MGYKVAWVARRGPDCAEMLEAFSLREMERFVLGPGDVVEIPYSLLKSTRDDGWTVLLLDGWDALSLAETAMGPAGVELSRGTELLVFVCTDTTNYCSLDGFRDGEHRFGVSWMDGMFDVFGELPAPVRLVVDGLSSSEPDAHADAPELAAEALVGFSRDFPPEAHRELWRLEPEDSVDTEYPRAPLWRRLFGRRV